MNSYVNKITKSINNFNLCSVANVYEIYNLFNDHLKKEISNKCLKLNLVKLMKILYLLHLIWPMNVLRCWVKKK